MVLGDSLAFLQNAVADESVDLIVTSPPYALITKKAYGNPDADDYLNWLRPFVSQFHRVLKSSGSLVINIGGAWSPGLPTRSLVHLELPIVLCREFQFHLAQEFYWNDPSRLPGPAEWVTVRQIRAKDAVEPCYWFSKTAWPKAGNRRVRLPYSARMEALVRAGCKTQRRPSGHVVTERIAKDNGGSIASNLLTIANTASTSAYLRYCHKNGIRPHPARFPPELPEVFVRLTTDPGDLVLDPFAGSCVTGEVSERLGRKWICVEQVEEYLRGAVGRFCDAARDESKAKVSNVAYKVLHPGGLWDLPEGVPLRKDGGKGHHRRRKPKK
ncbi:MAG TPA: site-specific DNA-methyltransferase [Chthoniobacteraceae bacterium]|jgi:site-specific DNA-methyltransferase (cytosine-N4-specific)|nr:site-specific DNA-methyltransferase [Chthoniobacteraceae bacterium]